MASMYVYDQGDVGSMYYRIHLPLKHCRDVLLELGARVKFARSFDFDADFDHDVYWFNRVVDPRFLAIVQELDSRGKTIIWDLDDDLFNVPDTNPNHGDYDPATLFGLQSCLAVSNLVVASTEPLRDRVVREVGAGWVTAWEDLDRGVRVLPNLIDLDDNPIPRRDDPTLADRNNVILYAGSPSHNVDALLLADLYHQTRDEFDWVFYGIRPLFLDDRATHLAWSRVVDYPRIGRMLRPRVVLAPLRSGAFNECKSAIKIWEGATYGGAVLASDVGPYHRTAGALVPADEPFAREHLDLALRPENLRRFREEAWVNSWGNPDQAERWRTFFRDVFRS